MNINQSISLHMPLKIKITHDNTKAWRSCTCPDELDNILVLDFPEFRQ